MDKRHEELQGLFSKLIDDYGEDDKLHTFEKCSNEGLGMDDSTIDAITRDGNGGIHFAYNENTGDTAPISHFKAKELQAFHDGLRESLENEEKKEETKEKRKKGLPLRKTREMQDTETKRLVGKIVEETLRRTNTERIANCITTLTPELAEKAIRLLIDAKDDAAFTMELHMDGVDEESLREHIGEKVYMAVCGHPANLMERDTLPMNFTLALADTAFEEGTKELMNALADSKAQLLLAGIAMKRANGHETDELLADANRLAEENEKENSIGEITPEGEVYL